MNKQELVTSIATKSGLSKKDSELALTAFLSSVEDTLANGDKVTLVGFGTFETVHRAEREGHNPQTKEKITISAKKAVKFKAGKGLKEIVNK